ncbi:MAG: polyprenyl diphosphate synthase [Chloroflexota bacterium]
MAKRRPASPLPSQQQRLPGHVAIIMDGNGRWAEQRGLPRFEGHRAGVDNINPIISYLNELRVSCVTLYGFSTENWSRPPDEVNTLLQLLEETLNREIDGLHRQGVRFRHLGRSEELPAPVQRTMSRAVAMTKDNPGMTLNLAFNYGGRREILDAVRRLIADGIPPQDIDEPLFSRYLYTGGLPDVDLVIRTGGEFRTSNFLIWQVAYSEYYFTGVLWPDFGREEMERALAAYARRQRRFGQVLAPDFNTL